MRTTQPAKEAAKKKKKARVNEAMKNAPTPPQLTPQKKSVKDANRRPRNRGRS